MNETKLTGELILEIFLPRKSHDIQNLSTKLDLNDKWDIEIMRIMLDSLRKNGKIKYNSRDDVWVLE